VLHYWGKARPTTTGEATYHPAAYHSLDVAACAKVILDRNVLLRDRFSSLLGLDAKRAVPLLISLIALHDVGKFSRPFQAKVSALWPAELGDIRGVPAEPHHDAAGLFLWHGRLADQLLTFMPQGLDLMPLARAVYGHHGSPTGEHNPLRLQALFGSAGLSAASQFAIEVTELLLQEPVTLPTSHSALNRASYAVAGLTVLADWIGSSQRWFPYAAPERTLTDYWHQRALPQAQRAVEAAGILPAPAAQVQSFDTLIGVPGFAPSDMQTWASQVELADGPALYIIEDATGSGKTEAALMLAHRLIAAGRGGGLYVALPTMATADAIYERLAIAYRNLFTSGSLPSLALAHGARDLHEGFTSSILDVGAEEARYGADDADETSSAACAAWIADNRRKTFLAHVGVGTVDQAILSVLPSRHQSLRLIGLAQRVLVLDEVHAYDAYMSQEIVRLLEFHAALGGSAVLLSATLPADTKRRLLAAYGGKAPTFSDAYPLATVQSHTGCTQTPRDLRPDTRRHVALSFVATPAEGLARALAAALSDQAVLYIRNTVADVMETYRQIGADVRPMLFHARFAMCDRLSRQSEVLSVFGKRSTPDARRRRLLVATQVVEQSLDLDFDLIVTDLAPVDLIVQRAGRLWRHAARPRPASARQELIVVGPEPDPIADATWLKRTLPRTSLLYEDARVWLTAQVLHTVGAIHTPDGLRNMIEYVYGADSDRRVPQGLVPVLLNDEGRRGAQGGLANMNLLRLSDGYARLGPWLSDEVIPTRLSDETTTLRLGVLRSGQIVPWAALTSDSTDMRRLWALSEVKVQAYVVNGEALAPEHVAIAEAAKLTWTTWDRASVRLVVLHEAADGVWRGRALADERAVDLLYCRQMGLRRN